MEEKYKVRCALHNLISNLELSAFHHLKKADRLAQEKARKIRTPLANKYARTYYHQDYISHEFLLELLDYVFEQYAIPRNTELWKREEGRLQKVGRHDKRMKKIIPFIKEKYEQDVSKDKTLVGEKHIYDLIKKHFTNKRYLPNDKSIKKYAKRLYETGFKEFR